MCVQRSETAWSVPSSSRNTPFLPPTRSGTTRAAPRGIVLVRSACGGRRRSATRSTPYLAPSSATRGAERSDRRLGENAPAQRLYATYDFEPVGIRRGYYQPSNTDALVMMRDG